MLLRYWRLLLAMPAAVALLVLSSLPSGALAQVPPVSQGGKSHRAVCQVPAGKDMARCHAQIRTDAEALGSAPQPAGSVPAVSPESANPAAGVVGNSGAYDPSYLQSAYNLAQISKSSGAARTVAIVDAYDAPNAASDLAAYRSYFGLPACSASSGCFRKVNQNGGTLYPAANTGWAQEISLDLDMVSAICPNCSILLVEANSASYADLGTAVQYAAGQPGVVAISNSYGGSEWNGETSYEAPYNHPGIAITVSSGDNGYGVEFPASSQYVTAVGGTTLNQATNTGLRNATETVWSGAGSGCSSYIGKPSWQTDSGCNKRAVADVAAEADPNTGVWVYYSGGWSIFGGTSVASPIVASVYALAGNSPSGTTSLNSYPYSHTASLFDVTSGSNSAPGCNPSYLCTGGPGYDGPTGLGTPNGVAAFSGAVATPDFSVACAPSSLAIVQGGNGTSACTITSTAGFSSAVSLSCLNAPANVTCGLSPTAVTPPANGSVASTLTVNVGSTVVAQGYTLQVQGTSGSLAHASAISLTVSSSSVGVVSPTNSTVTANPTSVTANGSSTATVTVTLKDAAGSPVSGKSVSLAQGAGLSTVTPASGTSNASGVVTFTVSDTNAEMVTYTATDTTDGSGVQISQTAAVTFTAPSDFDITACGSLTIRRFQSTTCTVTLTSLGGTQSPVSLSVSGLPRGASATFSPSTVTPTNSSTLTITVGSKTGTYTLTITGKATGGKPTHSTTVTLQVSP